MVILLNNLINNWTDTADLNVSLSLVSYQVMSDSLRPRGLPHARSPSPSLSLGVFPSSSPLNQWCYPTISFSATLFSFCLQSLPASASFPVSWLLASDAQIIEASTASVLTMSIQGWFPLGLTGLISLLSKRLSRVFTSNLKASILQCSVFFIVQLSHPYMTTGKTIALTLWILFLCFRIHCLGLA